ncbi:DUF5610 domain-containing protein [Aestuariibacter salexigens]|uniref:DUF5610 domain-containing protein n=1 Tax=Aestuariibacter salexigens TaxID=226010 RepID=UPI0003FEEF07|nr:DUF5610 domain-containing protein [Aestuariibacter salexigens]
MSIDPVNVRPSDASSAPAGKDPLKQKTDAQLQKMGLEQARNGINVPAKGDTASVSAQNTVGLRIVSYSYSESVVVDERKPRLPDVDKEKKDTSLFDFEEVAKNVMNFVGGVIKGAAQSGADQDKLESLFEQARRGVGMGVEMARRDLGGMVNDTIDTGIKRSQELIEQGIGALEQELLTDKQAQQASETQVANSSEQQAGLVIRTKDGDEVSVYFGRAESQSLNTQSRVASADGQITRTEQSQFEYSRQQQFSIAVSGDIDKQELDAIGNLINDITDLADTFFNKDIESAFEQAKELGYNRDELAGFALQLKRSESVSISNAYSEIQNLDKKQQSNKPSEEQGAIRRVVDYMEKLEERMERVNQRLQPQNGFDRLVSGIINELGVVGTRDLVDAINRFHTVNQQLITNYPIKSEGAAQ